jgi:hypothetical protein
MGKKYSDGKILRARKIAAFRKLTAVALRAIKL